MSGADIPRFVDIHSHLLPGIDDGAETLDTTLALIDQGLADGIGTWVVTPHVLETFDERIDDRNRRAYDDLRDELARRDIPAEIHLGTEIMYQPDLATVRRFPSATFAGNGRYCLVEFPFAIFPPDAEDALFACQMSGMTPIVAHPERNTVLAAKPAIVARMAGRGILIQVNARSFTRGMSDPARSTVENLLHYGAIHFVASDAHHPDWRPARLREAWDRVADLAGEETARRLFVEHPRMAIEGQRIRVEPPEMPERDDWLRRIFRFGRSR